MSHHSLPASAQRGVLLVIADDWSPIAGCYGDDFVQTPHIDRLARQATVFDQAHCVSPSCAASRASLLTGRYPHTHGQYGHCHSIHGFRTHEHIDSLPKLTRAHGVRSALFGKTHIAPESVYPFDEQAMHNLSPSAMGRALVGFMPRDAQRFVAMLAPSYPHRAPRAGVPNSQDGWLLEHCVDEFDDPAYDPAAVTIPFLLRSSAGDQPATRGDLVGYYQGVSRFDRCVGAALEALEASGRAQDTLVLVLSDHGMPFPGAKASWYEDGHRCPLLIRVPGRPAQRCAELVTWVDLLPTICDWLGMAPPTDLPGRSLMPLLLGDADGWDRDEIFTAHCFHEICNYAPYRVLRGPRYKLVQHLNAGTPLPMPADLFRSPTYAEGLAASDEAQPPWVQRCGVQPTESLYDLVHDPQECVNLLGAKRLPPGHHRPDDALIDGMRSRLMLVRERTSDPWLEIAVQGGYELRTGVSLG